MNIEKLENKTLTIINKYLADLDKYSYEQLILKPDSQSWSLGQVYIHLWMSAKGFFFKKAEACLSKESAVQGKRKNWKGQLVFLLGRMPYVRAKMPAKVSVEPRQPESKEQLKTKLNEIKGLSSSYIHRMVDHDPSYKTEHPIFGYLNAAEWISLCNMHFRHHEDQKKRILEYFEKK